MAFLQTNRERLLGGLAALAVVAGGGYFFGFKPGYEFYRGLEDQILNRQKTWVERRERLTKAKEYEARYNKVRESLSLEGDEQDKREQISQQLTSLLEEVNVVARNLSKPTPDQINDQFRIYSFNLRGIETDWPTLASLLYKIEDSDAVLEVSKLTVKKLAQRGDQVSGKIGVDLEISRLVEYEAKRKRGGARR